MESGLVSNLFSFIGLRTFRLPQTICGFLILGLQAWGTEWAYQERPGLWRTIDDTQIQSRVSTPTHILKAVGITWSVIYKDTAGQGFKDTTQGASRQATVDAVLAYIGS